MGVMNLTLMEYRLHKKGTFKKNANNNLNG